MTAPSPFQEIQFPTAISYGAVGGPGFHTTVLTLASGFERRNIDWSLARAQYDVAQAIKTQADLNTLIQFFMARNGKAYGFRFQDWTDYQIPDPGVDEPPVMFTTVGAGPGTFQIVKVYSDVGNTYTRIITKPQAGTVVVYDNGVITSDWSVDTTTGVITLGSTTYNTTGHAISVSCQFDTPVRFDIDQMKTSINDYNNFTWGQIPLLEVRVVTGDG